MTENEKTLLATITRLETENAALRQQVDALSRVLAADTPEYRALVERVRWYQATINNHPISYHKEDYFSMVTRITADYAILYINATEAAKANAGAAGDGDGEAG